MALVLVLALVLLFQVQGLASGLKKKIKLNYFNFKINKLNKSKCKSTNSKSVEEQAMVQDIAPCQQLLHPRTCPRLIDTFAYPNNNDSCESDATIDRCIVNKWRTLNSRRLCLVSGLVSVGRKSNVLEEKKYIVTKEKIIVSIYIYNQKILKSLLVWELAQALVMVLVVAVYIEM